MGGGIKALRFDPGLNIFDSFGGSQKGIFDRDNEREGGGVNDFILSSFVGKFASEGEVAGDLGFDVFDQFIIGLSVFGSEAKGGEESVVPE